MVSSAFSCPILGHKCRASDKSPEAADHCPPSNRAATQWPGRDSAVVKSSLNALGALAQSPEELNWPNLGMTQRVGLDNGDSKVNSSRLQSTAVPAVVILEDK